MKRCRSDAKGETQAVMHMYRYRSDAQEVTKRKSYKGKNETTQEALDMQGCTGSNLQKRATGSVQ